MRVAGINEYISEYKVEECEPEINVEAWMVNIERFEQELLKSDPEVEIEEWMYNEYFRFFYLWILFLSIILM